VSVYQANEAGQPAGGTASVRKGIVRKANDKSVEVVLDGAPFTPDEQHARWTLDLRPDDRTFRLMAEALSHWINVEEPERQALRDAMLRGDSAALQGQGPEVDSGLADLAEGLNPDQTRALHLAWSHPALTLLHGPPGTGKTTTLVAMIRGFARQQQRILATAPSNTAVDLLALRCREAGLDVVRIGHPIRIEEAVLSSSLESKVEAHPEHKQVRALRKRAKDAWREADRFRRNFTAEDRKARTEARREARDLEREANDLEAYLADRILADAQVICATLAGASDRLLAGRRFDVAVIDEAGQALEPATWIPMQRADRFVIAGDPQQLPPVVKSHQALALGLETSLLEKLMARHKGAPIAHQLRVQYRMHEKIQGPPSDWFYDGTLEADASVADRGLPGLPPWTWLDTAGRGFEEQREAGSDSTCNPDEAAFVVERALELHKAHPEASMGVVAPYAAQVRALEEAWPGPVPAPVVISTVDGFQGQERDIMVLSMTRSNDSGQIGFLQEHRRTNVAMTRARKHLLIVGDTATLGADAFFAGLIERAEVEGAYRSAWEFV
jgi:superfamily I DNA and/or RNA helicase